MLLMTLRGTPTLYYGDEIGMQHAAILQEQVRDPFEKNVPGIGKTRSLSLPVIAKVLEEDLERPSSTPYLLEESEVVGV